ncbi:Ketoacyl-ACP Reductase [Zostera marina]|uniref:Ketoacyl-ACP Reductase n=1 Tax=Zostera marina TaxID=29655 RepID=A0A0K9PJ27_ZOSMR|nr:Ketoacyl-ACP Reductase [Zostera marina]
MKVVLVTGASTGIGREICLDLARTGCKIVAAARRLDKLNILCSEINAMENGVGDIRAFAVEIDLSANGNMIEASVGRAWDAFGRIDVLVNNAGIRGNVNSPTDISEEEWQYVLAVNITGTWLVSKFVCSRMMIANQKGSLINISSCSAMRGVLPGGLHYVLSKTAVNAMCKSMALELGRHGIRVNAICPGLFRSEITDKLMNKPWLNNVIAKTYPLQSSGMVNPALTSLVQYLLDDSSDYVTGNMFIVDSGATLPGIPIFSSL